MSICPNLKKFARVRVKRAVKTGAALASAAKPVLTKAPGQVFILMYHRVNSFRGNELSVTPKEFRRQVSWLKSNGYGNMKMKELEELEGCEVKGVPRVIFSFDDGYEDNFLEAFPVLKEFGYTGIFYLTADYVGSNRIYANDAGESGRFDHNRIMNWDQARELLREGMELGSHTLTHERLTNLSREEAEREITGSRKKLEDTLGVEITSFCYPGGKYDAFHVECCRRAGYGSACTAAPGIWRGHDIMEIPRVPVLRSDGFFVFRQKMTGRMEWFKYMH